MSSNHYIVSRSGAYWHASFRGTVLGPFSTSEEAVEAAILDAEKHTGTGTIEIFVQNENRETVSVWKST